MTKKERIIVAFSFVDTWVAIIQREIELLKHFKTCKGFKIKDKRRLGRLIRQRQQAIKKIKKEVKND